MNYFLAKTHPETYAISDLAKDKETLWDGVHNAQAIAVIKQMKPNDKVLIYHSGASAAIVGIAEVISMPIDMSDTRKSWAVKMKYLHTFDTPLLLRVIKATRAFDDWSLVKQGRLSTMEVPKEFIMWMTKKGFTVV